MTAMGMVAGLCAIAMTGHAVATRIAVIVIVAAALCALRALVISLNPAETNWNGPMWPSVIACLVLASAIPALFPHAFTQARVTKLAVISLAVPLATYFMSIDYSRFAL